MCRNAEDARDVAQETLLAAARSIGGFRGASSPTTWLYAIARRFCIKARRQPRHAPATVLSSDHEGRSAVERIPAEPHAGPEQALDDRRLAAALQSAIGGLEPKYREVLVLRDVEGLSAAEVAEVVGLGVDAVKSRLHRARLQVRAQLTPWLGRHEGEAGCLDVVTLFSRHLEGEIDGPTCAAMERHLAACPRCRSACDSLRRVLALCRSGPGREVPADLQGSIRDGIRAFLRTQPPAGSS
jgi:RNA polymerase sigma-70 factor (ECF subfamily)